MKLVIAIGAFFFMMACFQVTWGMRDPTQPARYQGTQNVSGSFDPSTAKLNSTIVSKGRKLAMVDGVFITVGDSFKGAKVASIEPGLVKFEFEGKTYQVRSDVDSIRRKSDQ